ncbi:uncharacterized protein LOC125231215 [Leguminivora glycinivorella]|uniref:uncharacterized protein LOC125231215 n=1 Tax=Leguminivora glycinivorella TaxID=1035111 RepID=UPI00200FD66B|nr:uncharacterized protein LOC125231215 [Leguminivora glycinivorella]
MRWSEAITLEFVKIYIKHECLWNPAHTGYKLKYQRAEAYSSIQSDFKAATGKSLSIPEIKIKIKNLRTTYCQQVQKILQKSSPDAIYEPSLVWFHEMDQCLKHVPTNRHSTSYINTHEMPEVDSSSQLWVDQDLPNVNAEDSNPDPLVPHTDDECDSNQLEDSENIKQEIHTSAHFKKIKKKKLKHRAKDYYSQSIDSVNQSKYEDEFDIYGKYIASQLRKMDLRNSLKLKLQIHSLVSEARLSDLSRNNI